MKKYLFILVILFGAACSGKEKEATAHITQRRLDKAGKLVISYQFNSGERLVYDSVEIPNRVIPHDSVKVVFSASNPEDSRILP
jgi:cytochrome c oxidase assembly protein Cox11